VKPRRQTRVGSKESPHLNRVAGDDDDELVARKEQIALWRTEVQIEQLLAA
jgi:hypothetical protein